MKREVSVGILLIVIGFISLILNSMGLLVYPMNSQNGTVWNIGNILFLIFFFVGMWLMIKNRITLNPVKA